MKIISIVILLLGLPSLALAGLQPTDFAYGMPLSLKEDGAIYRLQVPVEVYQTVTRGDLGDIRVFNNAKAMVPHVVRRPKIKNKIQERKKGLPFFPLYRVKGQKTLESLSVRIVRNSDGTVLDIHSSGASEHPDQELFGYIIDAKILRDKVDALDITWKAPGDNFMATVSLEHSTDLTHWRTLVNRTTLARMTFKGHTIVKERVEIPSTRAKYMRLLWSDSGTALQIRGIVAVQRSDAQAKPHHWKPIKGQPSDASNETNNKITAYEYDGNAQLPVDRVRMRFAEKNTVLEADLFSRPDRTSSWRHRKKDIFYNLSMGDTDLVKDTLSLPMTSDRYWRVEIAKDALGDAGNIPVLELGWQPHELLFTARGQGPFLLAYGSARLGENTSQNTTPDLLSQILGSKEKNLLKEATVLPRKMLGGPDLLNPDPPSLPWRKWLLWGVLVAGVGLIARMAMSLSKGMNKEKA